MPYSLYSKGVAGLSPPDRCPGIGVVVGAYAVAVALIRGGLLAALVDRLNG